MQNHGQQFSQTKELKLNYNHSMITTYMSEHIVKMIPHTPKDYIFLCIGTDRSTGDSLGPFVGTLLNDRHLKEVMTYGSLHEPIHAQNLEKYLELIYEKYANPFIITIDAGLGRKKSIGQIISGKGSIQPGSALQKDLPSLGHLHLIGIVNLNGFMENTVLQNTRLSVVIDMAKSIADILTSVDQGIYNNLEKILS